MIKRMGQSCELGIGEVGTDLAGNAHRAREQPSSVGWPCAVLCLAAQSCPTLCDPMDYSLPGSSVHGDSPGKNTGVSFHALLQGIFPRSQALNPGLHHCRWILYRLNQYSYLYYLRLTTTLQSIHQYCHFGNKKIEIWVIKETLSSTRK